MSVYSQHNFCGENNNKFPQIKRILISQALPIPIGLSFQGLHSPPIKDGWGDGLFYYLPKNKMLSAEG